MFDQQSLCPKFDFDCLLRQMTSWSNPHEYWILRWFGCGACKLLRAIYQYQQCVVIFSWYTNISIQLSEIFFTSTPLLHSCIHLHPCECFSTKPHGVLSRRVDVKTSRRQGNYDNRHLDENHPYDGPWHPEFCQDGSWSGDSLNLT